MNQNGCSSPVSTRYVVAVIRWRTSINIIKSVRDFPNLEASCARTSSNIRSRRSLFFPVLETLKVFNPPGRSPDLPAKGSSESPKGSSSPMASEALNQIHVCNSRYKDRFIGPKAPLIHGDLQVEMISTDLHLQVQCGVGTAPLTGAPHPGSCTFAGCGVHRTLLPATLNPCTAPWFLHRDGFYYWLASSSESTSSPFLFQYFAEPPTLSFQVSSDCFWPFSCHIVSRPLNLPSFKVASDFFWPFS